MKQDEVLTFQGNCINLFSRGKINGALTQRNEKEFFCVCGNIILVGLKYFGWSNYVIFHRTFTRELAGYFEILDNCK